MLVRAAHAYQSLSLSHAMALVSMVLFIVSREGAKEAMSGAKGMVCEWQKATAVQKRKGVFST